MITDKKNRLINTIKPFFFFHELRRAIIFLKPFIWQQKKAYIGLLLLLGADVIFTIAFAWFFGHMTNAAIQSDFTQIKGLIPIGITLTLLSISSNFLSLYLETIALEGVKKEIKDHLFHHILRLPVNQTSKHHTGELLSRFTTDIHSIDGMIGSSLINLVRLPVIYIVVFIYLSHLNLMLSIICLSIGPVAVISGIVFGLILRKNSRFVLELISQMNSLLNDTFHGLREIRSFTLEKLFYRKYFKKNQDLYRLELANTKLQAWFYSGGQFISSAVYLTCLSFGAYFVTTHVMTVGALLTFVSLVNHLVYPMTGLASQWAGFQRSVVATERIISVLEQPASTSDLPVFIVPEHSSKKLTVQNVTFSYDENTNVFKNLSLQIPAGKTVALVGPSGAGKSTLLSLFQGFYKPESGKILVGDAAIEDMTFSELRSAIAYVPQETFLFSGSIRENLMTAKPGITDHELIRAAKSANIYEFILTLPDGYESQVGEQGARLSGGQKQRIAIARAILKDAPILLLDEATSALDNETEYQVRVALNELMIGRTTLVIAHRLSTIQNADLIVVMADGEIIQTGNHEELIQRPGLYRSLYESLFSTNESNSLQKGAFLLEQTFDSSLV